MGTSIRVIAGIGLLAIAGSGACSDGTTQPEAEVVLLSVQPQGNQVGVAVDGPVVITFDHPLMAWVTANAALHEGPVTGPVVPGAWSLSPDATVLTFTPDQALKPATAYTIHLGGGMRGAHGEAVDFETHGAGQMGGQWATGGMMGGGMGGGMGGSHPHMGEGWSHANGTYGMVFTFTTAG